MEESMATRRDGIPGRHPTRLRFWLTFATLAGLVLALAPFQMQVARAASLTVNSTADVIANDGFCTLREAIIAANTNAPSGAAAGECPAGEATPDTITLAAGATYTLIIPNPFPTLAETNPATGDLDIAGDLNIVVAGVGTATIDANGDVTHDRAFEIDSGTVSVTGVTIRNGKVSPSISPTSGGGIFQAGGNLTLTSSTVSGNSVLGSAFPFIGYGGGIATSAGTLTINASTISDNSAQEGGGLANQTATLTITNSTISGNTATGSSFPISTPGSALYNVSVATLINVTIANNSNVGIGQAGGVLVARNTIVTNNTTANCSVTGGPIIEPPGAGNNLDSGTSCGFQAVNGSLPSTDPQLLPLGNYGGPTQTQAMSQTSPAVDKIPVASCIDALAAPLTTDQRGFPRPVVNGAPATPCDIGAVEVQTPPTLTAVSPNSGPTSGGTPITITGTGFSAGASVTVGGVACVGVAVNGAGTEITCTTPPHTEGLQEVRATNPDALFATGTFTYIKPTLAAVTPNSGPTTGGTSITLTGTNFVAGATVTVGGRPCAGVTVVNATTITCTTPSGFPGPADVTAVNPNAPGTSGTATLAGGFTYQTTDVEFAPSPLIFPNQVIATTGLARTVTLTNHGTGDLVITAVALGGTNPGDFVIASNGCLTTVTPNGTCTVGVQFRPTVAELRSAALVFTDNADGVPGSMQSAALIGNGTASMFADVPQSRPDYEAINQLASRGFIRGTSPTTFEPDSPVLRAQSAALIGRSLSYAVGSVASNPFPDRCDPANPANCIDDELWGYVATLAAGGVAQGYSDAPTCTSAGTTAPCYLPRDPVLGVQVISFITRAMVNKGYWTAVTTDDPTIYPNVPLSSGNRLDLLTYVKNAGALPGLPTSGPFTGYDQQATRGFYAQVLWQAYAAYFYGGGTPTP
jgi:CSLREA domain-containing protein